MPSRWVVLVDPSGAVCARPANFREWAAAHVAPERLDLALAGGARPEDRPDLALRARWLASPRTRRMLAGSLRRLLRRADGPVEARSRLAPVVLDRVARAHQEIELLLERLLAPAPVPARGVAMVNLLLSDGTGPLYRRGSRADLAAMVTRAVDALDPVNDWPA
jgi:hypothetical protein